MKLLFPGITHLLNVCSYVYNIDQFSICIIKELNKKRKQE